jgi:hypothetical protein
MRSSLAALPAVGLPGRCNGFGSDFISSVLCLAKGRLEVKTGGLDTLVKVNNKNLTDFFKEKNLNPVYIYENLELDTTQKRLNQKL